MAWEHCGESLVDTDATCPTCGITKQQWTVEFDVTREFKVRRQKLIRVKLLTFSDDPMPGEPCEVLLPGGESAQVATDETGLAKAVARQAGQGTVRLTERTSAEVHIDRDDDEGGEPEEPGAVSGPPVEFAARAGGTLRLQLAGPGPNELINARWSKLEARVGDEVELAVDAGFADGTEVTFRIREQDADGEDDPVAEVTGQVEGQVARARWTFAWTDDEDDAAAEDEAFPAPEYVFRAECAEAHADSRLLRFKDWVELELLDREEQPLAGIEVTLTLADGSTRTEATNEEGIARWEDVPAGEVSFDYQLPAEEPREEAEDDEPEAHSEEGLKPLPEGAGRRPARA